MPQKTADVPQRQLAKAGIVVSGEQRLTVSPQALVGMHPATVIAKERLWHKGDRLPVLIRNVAHHVLVDHHVVGRFHERVEFLVYFALAARAHFVMMALD